MRAARRLPTPLHAAPQIYVSWRAASGADRSHTFAAALPHPPHVFLIAAHAEKPRDADAVTLLLLTRRRPAAGVTRMIRSENASPAAIIRGVAFSDLIILYRAKRGRVSKPCQPRRAPRVSAPPRSPR
jgi:hypothetical protein